MNEKTKLDHHPLQRIQDAIDSLSGKSYTVLDQQIAYHLKYLDAVTQALTSGSVRNVTCLCNAPAVSTFQGGSTF